MSADPRGGTAGVLMPSDGSATMSMTRDEALRRMRETLGAQGVIDDPAALEPMLVDERRLYRGRTALAVQPADTAQVAQVLALCNAAGIGVVPQGGNTGYCGGATPDESGTQVLLSLARMHRVREVDPVGFTITVEAGARLVDVQQAAAGHGLLFPLSMGSEGSCRIGGNLATNAGGLAVLKYGTARDLVLGLEAVLPDGRVFDELRGLRKDNTGYDLKQLFVGAEGTLGVITAAVLKLYPQATETQTAWLAVPDADAACRLLGRARRVSGDTVTSFEYVSRASLELVLRHVDGAVDPLDAPAGHYVLMELSAASAPGSLREVMERVLADGMEDGEVLDGVLAESGPQRSALWRLRERVPEAERHAGGALKHDVSVRIGRIPDYLAQAARAVPMVAGCRVSVYGHIGDGNLHFNLLAPDGEDAAEWRQREGERLSAVVHGLAASLHGSFSAEHGVGRLKRGELLRYKDPVSLALLSQLKQALDPRGIMNPGKVVGD